MTERRRLRLDIPSRLLHGRVRTSTLALCLLWLGMWMLYLFINQEPEPEGGVPQQAVIISDRPYVPYVPPVEPEPVPTVEQFPTESTTVPPTGTPTPTEDTTGPGDATTAVPTTAVPTTAGQAPFQFPRIPGIPNLGDRPGTEPTGESGG
ncbi:hypothetical protein [Rhodococcus chondri]|uniref:Energy transducer TonB n=1 Tax=Rhodococcus chondri TaxID=3065941 RepID=A0ABU7JMG0_9NOCA|nr:hypothetical protein [Rhodococcus sp. CC-R104]MEE2031220.1 hypothetical protein [Rhodococcus sp. CC-R104]